VSGETFISTTLNGTYNTTGPKVAMNQLPSSWHQWTAKLAAKFPLWEEHAMVAIKTAGKMPLMPMPHQAESVVAIWN